MKTLFKWNNFVIYNKTFIFISNVLESGSMIEKLHFNFVKTINSRYYTHKSDIIVMKDKEMAIQFLNEFSNNYYSLKNLNFAE